MGEKKQLQKLGDYIQEVSLKNKLNEDIPVYSVSNSKGFCKDYFGKEVASQDKSTYKIVPFGCFAYNPSRINVGSVDYQREEDRVIVSPLYNVFEVNDKLLQKYLLYYLKRDNTLKIIDAIATGTVRSNLKFSMLKDFKLPIPSINEQQQIVAELDLLSHILDQKRQQLKEYDALAESIFYDMFGDPVENPKGWKVAKLGGLSQLKNGLNFDKLDHGTTIKIVGVSDFQNNRMIRSDKLNTIYLSNAVDDYLLNDDDLIFVRSNGSKALIGRCALIETNNEDIVFSGFCIRCRITSDLVLPRFASFVMQSNTVRELITNAGQGCNISNVNQKILSAFDIPLPPLSLQQSFASKIEAIEKQKQMLKESIKETETLFQSRMDYWFNA